MSHKWSMNGAIVFSIVVQFHINCICVCVCVCIHIGAFMFVGFYMSVSNVFSAIILSVFLPLPSPPIPNPNFMFHYSTSTLYTTVFCVVSLESIPPPPNTHK